MCVLIKTATSFNCGILWKAILDKSGRVFLGRSRIFSDGREFSQTVENFLGRSRIFSDDREFSRTVENFLGRSRIFSDSRDFKFSQTIENASAVCRQHFPPNLINMATQPMARGTGQNYICKIYIIAVSNIIQLFKFIKICYEYM